MIDNKLRGTALSLRLKIAKTMPTTTLRRAPHIFSALFAIGIAPSVLPAQEPRPRELRFRELRFDVASVRANREKRCMGAWDFSASHGTVTAVNAPLLRIVSRAWNLTDDRVSGPAWMDSECYDIKAKAAADTTRPELMAMLRELLKERFHVAAYTESEERPVFVLSIDKSGLKMQPYSDKASAPPSNGGILFMARHLPDLCERIGKVTGRPVIDKTGLDGDYMIALTYLTFTYPAFSDPAFSYMDPPNSTSDIFSAVREQLGLQLRPQRGVVDVLKIDSTDKIPTGN